MFKKLIAALLVIVSISLCSCSSVLGGLQSYIDSAKGYEFLYPNGWVPVDVKGASEGVDLVFHDIVERSENLSVIISSVPNDKTLEELGTPSEVGYRFLKATNSNPNSNREAEFISAQSHEARGKTYYILEYEVKSPDQRHNLASIAVSRGQLFTFNLSTRQRRWPKVEDRFRAIANSFTVY